MVILCDFDGTLVDVKEKYYAVYCEFVELHKGSALPLENYWKMKRVMLPNDEVLQASGLHNIDSELFTEYIKDNIEREIYLKMDMLFPDSESTLRALSHKHICYLVSMRRNRNMFIAQAEWLGIRQYFREIISPQTFDADDKLPDNRKSKALENLDISMPALIIGDSGMDIETGKRLKIHTCAVTTGVREKSVLERYSPDFIINSIGDLHTVIDTLSKPL